jgi:hypothetical protein
MSKYNKEDEVKEENRRNIFRCTLQSIFYAFTNAFNGIERVFIHEALKSPQLYS